MARIITVAIEKGGIGKTTTVVNLATLLAKDGKKTLVIDCDPQANATLTLTGIEKTEWVNKSLFDLIRSYNIAGVDKHAFVHPTSTSNLDIIPSSIHTKQILEQIKIYAQNYGQMPYKFLIACIEDIIAEYDYVIFDTPPSQDELTTSALYASHDVIMPILAEKYSKQGLINTFALIHELTSIEGIDINILGILFVKTERTVMQDVYREQIVDSEFGKYLFKTEIRKGQSVNESIEFNQAVVDMAPRSNPAIDYVDFYKELKKRLKESK